MRTAGGAIAVHLLLLLQLQLRSASGQVTCGDGTTQVVNECVASHMVSTIDSDIYLTGIFDNRATNGYAAMTRHHFQLAVDLINDKNDGFFDHYCVDDDGHSVPCRGVASDVIVDMMLPTIHTDLANSACSETKGGEAYWEARQDCGGTPLHGIIGCRCSGASMAVARTAGLEHVPQISMSSTSPKLSDTEAFPYFFRTVAPDGNSGTLGAIVQLFRAFEWDTLTILYTDKPWASSTALEFAGLWAGYHAPADGLDAWTGNIEFQAVIGSLPSGEPDPDAVNTALDSIEGVGECRQTKTADCPNSRVIFLIAHAEDAVPIFTEALDRNFQPDSVWVGPGSWPNEAYPQDDWNIPSDSWVPGYIGVVPFQNTRPIATEYRQELNQYEYANGLPVSSGMSTYGAETVDAVVAMAIALNSVNASERSNGTVVKQALQHNTFDGVSGNVRFDENGDRADPLFTVVNLGPMIRSSGEWQYTKVGYVGVHARDTFIHKNEIWWAGSEAMGGDTPADQYPVVEPPPDHTVLIIVIVGFSVLIVLMIVAACIKRKNSKHKNAKRRAKAAADAKDAMEKALAAQKASLELEKQNMRYPNEWKMDPTKTVQIDDDDAPGGKKTVQMPEDGLVEILQTDPEYWTVYNELTRRPNADFARNCPTSGNSSDKQGMQDAWITALYRIQNADLYTYYHSQKKRLIQSSEKGAAPKAFTAANEIREVLGWHGTGQFDASNIYEDRQDGFMMQFASQGQWGRGLYFADEAGYSDFYATKAAHMPDHGQSKGMQYDESEFMLASVLIGNTVEMDRDNPDGTLNEPMRCTRPPSMAKGLKYNTVRGYTQCDQRMSDGTWIKNPRCPRSKVWIVYENGRAYPRYLVRYYRGAFDPKRVQYRSAQEAGVDTTSCVFEGLMNAASNTTKNRPQPRPSPSPAPPPLPSVFYHIAPDGTQQAFGPQDCALISDARQRGSPSQRINDVRLPNGQVLAFEIRFGANAVSSKMTRPPPSGMVQVNLSNDNTRVVVEGARP